MARILLVRHGQASWGAADYDQLSEVGERQSRHVGEVLAARGVRPDLVVRGTLRRHAQTAEATLAGGGWAEGSGPEVVEEPGWDEFHHEDVFAAHPTGLPEGEWFADEADFRRWFDAAMTRWTGGGEGYREPFSAFGARVVAALQRTVDALGEDGRTALVFTSGGAISWVVTHLLSAPAPTWQRLNFVTANASLTHLHVRDGAASLLTYNDHSHFTGPDAELLTFR